MEANTEHVVQSTARPASRRRTTWSIGCASVVGLVLVVLIVWVVLGQQQAAQVKGAIENTMPDYCQGVEGQMRAFPDPLRPLGMIVPFPARHWHVTCWSSGGLQPDIEIDRQRCEARVVSVLGGTHTETLDPCP